jgi:uncharacterized membrane protein
MTTRRAPGWAVPTALIALSAVPLAAGAARLVQLAGGPAALPADPRFAGQALPVVVHLLGVATYVLVGALQFVPRFRRRHLTWHRRAGRVVAAAGLLVTGSALWMTLMFARKPGTGELLYALRLVVAPVTATALVLGILAARRHDLAAHRAWMIRAYALSLAAGTQAFTGGVGGALIGTGPLAGDIAKAAGWVINLAVAEWVIRRGATPRPGPGRLPRRPQSAAVTPALAGLLPARTARPS